MPSDALSGSAVFPDGVRFARILLNRKSGTILTIEDAEPQTDERLIFPGFMDIHVHAREYPRPLAGDPKDLPAWEAACRKETFETAGLAAVNGGITAFCAMPNDPRPPSDEESYRLKKALTLGSPCPVVLFAAITRSSEPWGDVPYKVYLDPAPSPISFSAWSDLENALARYKGCRIFFHAEDPEILRQHGEKGPRWLTRPPEAEISAVEKILELTAKLGLRSHICHVSTEKAARSIADYNAGCGDNVTCEVTPHHLYFSVDEGAIRCAEGIRIADEWLLECNPPLRTEADRRFLVEALREGFVQVLASDHAPHTLEDKSKGAPGMPHLDTLGPFAGWLIKKCGFSPVRIAEVLALEPARIFSGDLVPSQGALEPGCAASFTVLDLGEPTEVEKDAIKGRGPLKTRCGWSPFSGMSLPSKVRMTVIRGTEYRFL